MTWRADAEEYAAAALLLLLLSKKARKMLLSRSTIVENSTKGRVATQLAVEARTCGST